MAFAVLAALRHWDSLLPNGLLEGIAFTTLIGGTIVSLRTKSRLRYLNLFVALSVLFSLVSFLSILQSAEPDAALKAWGRLASAQCLGLGCYLLAADRVRLRWFTFGGLTGVGLIAFGGLGFLAPGGQPLDLTDENGRLQGPAGDPNFYGQFLAVGFALGLAVLLWERRLVVQVFAIAITVGTFVAIIRTESRGTLIAVVAIGLLHLVQSRRAIRIALTLVAIATVVFVTADVESDMLERLSRAPASVTEALDTGAPEDTAVGGRVSEAIAATQMTLDNPVLGVGIGNYRYRYLDYSSDIGIDGRAEERDAHNRHLEVAAESGLLGAMAWVLLVLAAAVLALTSLRVRTAPRDVRLAAQGWAGVLVGWLITSVFLHDYQLEVEWLVLGGVFAAAEVARRSQPSGHPAASPGDEPAADPLATSS